MQEAEVRRIMVQRQPRQVVHKTPISKKTVTEKGLVEWPWVQAPVLKKKRNDFLAG
jgi:hypothetical protein